MIDAQILDLLADAPVMPRSEVYYISRNAHGKIIFKQSQSLINILNRPNCAATTLFVTVYRTSMSQPLQLELFGIYSEQGFNAYDRDRTVVSRRKNLNGLELRACMVVTSNDTLNHLTDYR